jgi:hypothetical protein
MKVVVVEWPGSCRVRVWFLCPCWLCTVTSASTVLGSPWLPVMPEGSTCPSGEAGKRRRGRAPLMTPRWLGRNGEMSSEAPIVPEASPQGSGEIEFAVCTLSGWHAVSAFLGPYSGPTNVQSVVFYPLLATLGILIPDTMFCTTIVSFLFKILWYK